MDLKNLDTFGNDICCCFSDLEISQQLIDDIDTFLLSNYFYDFKAISSKINFASSLLIKSTLERKKIFSILNEFSLLLFLNHKDIYSNQDLKKIILSFISTIRDWFISEYLNDSKYSNEESIISDFNTIKNFIHPVEIEFQDDIFDF